MAEKKRQWGEQEKANLKVELISFLKWTIEYPGFNAVVEKAMHDSVARDGCGFEDQVVEEYMKGEFE